MRYLMLAAFLLCGCGVRAVSIPHSALTKARPMSDVEGLDSLSTDQKRALTYVLDHQVTYLRNKPVLGATSFYAVSVAATDMDFFAATLEDGHILIHLAFYNAGDHFRLSEYP